MQIRSQTVAHRRGRESFRQAPWLNAAVYVLDGFAGHADRNDLAWWFEQTGGQIEHGFLVHGEPSSAEALAATLRNERGWNVTIPDLGESHELV